MRDAGETPFAREAVNFVELAVIQNFYFFARSTNHVMVVMLIGELVPCGAISKLAFSDDLRFLQAGDAAINRRQITNLFDKFFVQFFSGVRTVMSDEHLQNRFSRFGNSKLAATKAL